jgi:hypothetical protein
VLAGHVLGVLREEQVDRRTAGGADTQTLALVPMLELAMRQMMQVQVMVPAF